MVAPEPPARHRLRADHSAPLALARAAGTMTGSAPASPGRTRVGPCQPRPAARRGRWHRHGLLRGRRRRRSDVIPRADPVGAVGHGPRSKPRLSGSSRVRSADPVTQVGPGLLSGRERWRLSVVRRQTRVKFITARALPDTRMPRREAIGAALTRCSFCLPAGTGGTYMTVLDSTSY